MKTKTYDWREYYKEAMRECDFAANRLYSQLPEGSVRRNAVNRVFARRLVHYFDEIGRFQSSAVPALSFLRSTLGLTTSEIATVFATSQRRVLAWECRYLLPRGQHLEMRQGIDAVAWRVQGLEGRLRRGRGLPAPTTAKAWFRHPNADLGGLTPVQALIERRYAEVVNAIAAEVDREPRWPADPLLRSN